MDASGSSPCVEDARLKTAPVEASETPSNYGTLGPGCDAAADGPDSAERARKPSPRALFVTFAIGAALALMVGSLSRTQATRVRSNYHSLSAAAPISFPVASAVTPRQLDRLEPQSQAETLLQLALAHSDGAVEQISKRIQRWQGKLQWDSQMATLTTAALGSNDMRVRESGIEVELAAYGLSKNFASLDHLLKSAESPDHAEKIWALWALGLMGNRGVETARVVETLTAHLKDPDVDTRHWTVGALALTGSRDTIPVLLAVMHDDPSPLIREEAACGLAQSGMFTHDQRLSAVPQLLAYTDDPSLDAQTRAWALQAPAEITGRHFPDDPAEWRNWYASSQNAPAN